MTNQLQNTNNIHKNLKQHMKNKQNNIILEFGGDGGSVKLIKIEKDYYFTTDESAFMDLLPGEFEADELVSTSGPFDDFDSAFEVMLKKYRVFSLCPLSVDQNFINYIRGYYDEYVKWLKDPSGNYNKDEWESLLNIEKLNYQEIVDEIFNCSHGTYPHRTLRTLFDPFSSEYGETKPEMKLKILKKVLDSGRLSLSDISFQYKYYYTNELNKAHVSNDFETGLMYLLELSMGRVVL